MNPAIASKIKSWETEKSPFSFELRIHPSVGEDTCFINLNFVIDVAGFFYDEEQTKPVKLHHERVISIEKANMDQQYAKDFARDLDLFTATAHAEFQKILATSPFPIHSSDPFNS